MSDEKKKEDLNNVNNGCAVIVFVVLAFILWVVTGAPGCPKGSGGSSRPNTPSDESSMAYVMAQSFVEKHLKSPSSAKYPWGYREYVKALPDNRYLVNAHVDSQNSFGAMLQSKFTAKLHHVGGEQWRCEYLEIGGQVYISSE